ncbi:hypothetical protein RAE08_05650 [Corynebacterium tuberculostearicum]|uniref:hypothetical protein n=1 Tax=Corynebacterium tuberculostearicum TaxID=38304 RepID=UPI00293472E9|nr:hypothetical protein [Corynebacterium tuberculostearicum]MDV2430620.1 hypothetical protein [Corynebacterium tuberculostearicum]
MDLSLVQTHLDNFVDTWEGWGKVVDGIDAWVGIADGFEYLKSAFKVFGTGLDSLSSK